MMPLRSLQAVTAPPRSVAVNGVRIVDPRAGQSGGGLRRIEVLDGRISRIRPATSPADREADLVVDGDGRYVVAGRVNAHDHLYSHELRTPRAGLNLAAMRAWIDARAQAETLMVMLRTALDQLAHGVTLIRDLGAVHGLNTVLARMVADGLVPGPAVVAAGRPIVMTGGHVWTFGRESDGPWACRQAVREQAKAGARVIKIMASGGLSHYPAEDFTVTQFTDDELAATIDEAHRVGLPACAHVFGAEAVERVVRLGIDVIEHGVEITDATLAAMAHRKVPYVPTLSNMRRIASREYNALADTPERTAILTEKVVGPHRDTVRRAIAAGVSIAVGTDSTGSYREELECLQSLGMTPQQLLAAATVNGAELCREPAGLLEPGRRADFTLHADDPLVDPLLLVEPDYVFCRGALLSGPVTGASLLTESGD